MESKSILIFGGGRIGRSFIGQLFGRASYEVIFSDVDPLLISELNRRKSYTVVIKGDREEILNISNVRAVSGSDSEAVIEEIAKASIMAVSVGKNVLVNIIPLIAKGLLKRYIENPLLPVDIIIAENMRSAAEYMRHELLANLPQDYPINKLVGLVETSIGKMVPIMTKADSEKDPLVIFAEPYNILIVDKHGFRAEMPDVEGLAPKENIQAWVDRKAFIHNMGHATSAYYGALKHPEAVYVYEVLKNREVYDFTKKVMMQSATILRAVYPDDFSMEDLEAHIDNLLCRFQNKALKDTIFRVGQDRPRKLGPDDRFFGIIRLAQEKKLDYDIILRAMACAFFFNATDENGKQSPEDILFSKYLKNGVGYVLQELAGFDPVRDKKLIDETKQIIEDLYT